MIGSILSLSEVTKVFGEGDAVVRALDEIDLEVSAGEIVVVTGPSGSGKTTLLQVAGALMSPTSGSVTLGGERVDHLPRRQLARLRAESIGFVFQSFNLFSNLTAESNVRLPASLVGGGHRTALDRARGLLRELGLSDRAHHLPGELSGGQQQRVAIARALVNEPPLILADEPTGNLDSRSGYLVLHLLEQLSRERGKTVVVVTHDYRIAEVADRVLWLEDGRFGAPPAEAETVVDPVCGMAIQADRAAAIRAVSQTTYHFCSEICVQKFDRATELYAS